MTCRAYRETLLDLARGVAMPPALARAAEAHAAACPACRIDFGRQRDLTVVLQALRDDAAGWSAPGHLEERLLPAFDAARPQASERVPRPRMQPFRYAAAAALVVAGVWLGVRESGPRATGQQQARNVDLRPPAAPQRSVDAGELPPPAAPARRREPTAGPERRARSRQAVAQRDPEVQTIEFFRIPAAVGLPPMESARIVRTEVPVSALPAYGVAIVPDAARSAVQADLLIGQDGLARGIRLVTARQEEIPTRSRQ